MIKRSLITVLMFLLTMPTIQPFFFSDMEDTRIVNWYEIEDWELDVCRSWAGTDNVDYSANIDFGSLFISQLTITLQGQKTVYSNYLTDNVSINTTTYEVAYYTQPLTNYTYFKIRLYNTITEEKYTVFDTAKAEIDGSSDYKAVELGQIYDEVQMKFNGTDSAGIFKAPIIDSEEGFTQREGTYQYGFSTTDHADEDIDWSDW